LLLAHNSGPPPDLELLGDLAAPAALRVRFGPDERPATEPGSEGEPAKRVVARLLAVVIQAEEKGTWERLKACRNEDCKWAFYDASKNRSGSWCNMSICVPGTRCAHTASANQGRDSLRIPLLIGDRCKRARGAGFRYRPSRLPLFSGPISP
jgi:predicted RNA-binding Zn ribbon-like protein